MKDFNLSEEMQELVRGQGDEVAVHEPPCVIWKADHESCEGCQYELGCGKAVRLMGIMLLPMVYTPNSFADHQAMSKRIQELMDMTMKATTPDELQLVPMD